MNKHTRELPMLATRAAVVAESFNPDTLTVDLTWSTGAQVRRFDWYDGAYLEELVISPEAIRMDRLNAGAPLLANHNAYELDAVIGVVERAWIDGKEAKATVRFSDREDVKPIVQDVRNGILRNISVGYQVHQYEEEKPAEKGGMPILRATDFEPMELSIVTIPADASAQIRSQDKLHPVTINQRSQAMSEPTEDQVPAEEIQTPESHEPEASAPAPAPDVDTAVRNALAGERLRVKGIRESVRMAKLDESVAENLIDSGKPLDECRAEVIRAWSEKVDKESTVSGRPDGDVNQPKSRAAELAQGLLKQVAGV